MPGWLVFSVRFLAALVPTEHEHVGGPTISACATTSMLICLAACKARCRLLGSTHKGGHAAWSVASVCLSGTACTQLATQPFVLPQPRLPPISQGLSYHPSGTSNKAARQPSAMCLTMLGTYGARL